MSGWDGSDFLYGVNDSIPLMHESYQDVMIHDVYLGAGP
jgi:hypothetical protein